MIPRGDHDMRFIPCVGVGVGVVIVVVVVDER